MYVARLELCSPSYGAIECPTGYSVNITAVDVINENISNAEFCNLVPDLSRTSWLHQTWRLCHNLRKCSLKFEELYCFSGNLTQCASITYSCLPKYDNGDLYLPHSKDLVVHASVCYDVDCVSGTFPSNAPAYIPPYANSMTFKLIIRKNKSNSRKVIWMCAASPRLLSGASYPLYRTKNLRKNSLKQIGIIEAPGNKAEDRDIKEHDIGCQPISLEMVQLKHWACDNNQDDSTLSEFDVVCVTMDAFRIKGLNGRMGIKLMSDDWEAIISFLEVGRNENGWVINGGDGSVFEPHIRTYGLLY